MKNTPIWLKILGLLGSGFLSWGLWSDLDAVYFGALDLPSLFSGRMLAAFLGFALIGIGGWCFWLLLIFFPKRFPPENKWRWLFWGGSLAVGAFCAWFIGYTSWGAVLSGTWLRVWLYAGAAGLVIPLAPRREGMLHWVYLSAGWTVAVSTMIVGIMLQTAVKYPFSLAWSEGNRLWDYSVLYGRNRFIYPADRSLTAYIDIGRQSLWGLPFLFPAANIQMVRLWNVILFSVPYAVLGWALFLPPMTEKCTWQRFFEAILMGLWVFLFLNQGPIYTPLVLSAILVVGARRLPWVIGAILVCLAGYYAQMSRVTWMVAPAMWSAVLVFCSFPANTWRRWFSAAGMGFAGLMGGYLIPHFWPLFMEWIEKLTAPPSSGPAPVNPNPILISPEGIGYTVTRQPLIWERLFPNATYPPGILLGLVLATLPLVALIVLVVRRRKKTEAAWHLDIWQQLAIVGMLLAFLAVGLLASIKIGGGSNLHNLDMFLIGLLFTASIVWEKGLRPLLRQRVQSGLVIVLLTAGVLYPPVETITRSMPLQLPTGQSVQEALTILQNTIKQVNGKGDILFMDQRQLLSFGYITGVPLVEEYEKKKMMDFAMTDNPGLFEQFNKDLARQRFALIISEPLWSFQRDSAESFGDEHTAWVRYVSEPVLCYYQPVDTFDKVGMQILAPRQKTCKEK